MKDFFKEIKVYAQTNILLYSYDLTYSSFFFRQHRHTYDPNNKRIKISTQNIFQKIYYFVLHSTIFYTYICNTKFRF